LKEFKGGKIRLRVGNSLVSHWGKVTRKPSKVEGIRIGSKGKRQEEGKIFQWGTTEASKETGRLSAGSRMQMR
jgi:hypothetical protein